MRPHKIACAGVTVVCLSAVVALAAPGLPRRLGLDFWAAPDLRRQVEANRRASDQLDAALDEVRERNRVKQAVLADLAANRLTLPEAAERILDATPPEVRSAQIAALRFHHPELTDGGLVYRHLIDCIRLGAAGPGSLGVVARLEAQWRAIADAEAALRARAGLLALVPGGRH